MQLKTKFSKEWKDWIQVNLARGVDKDYIFNTLIENGFSYISISKFMRYEPEIKQNIPENWINWLNKNISLGRDKDGLFKVLLMNGFSFDAIKRAMHYQPSVSLDHLQDPFKLQNQTHQIFNNLNSRISKHAIKIKTDKLDIFYKQSFLTEAECDILSNLIKEKLRPSELASPDEDIFFRTSKTCDLDKLQNRTVQDINQRICELVGIQDDLSEPIQGQYYEPGDEFKPHTDFFETSELRNNAGILGQRTYTVMIYLNSTEAGGETTFPLIKEEFCPEKGKAIFWSNLNADLSPNPFSLHHAKKVQRGHKSVITKWFRTGIPVK